MKKITVKDTFGVFNCAKMLCKTNENVPSMYISSFLFLLLLVFVGQNI